MKTKSGGGFCSRHGQSGAPAIHSLIACGGETRRQDTRHKTQDTRHKTQDTRHKTQDTRHKTQDTRHKTQDTRQKTKRASRGSSASTLIETPLQAIHSHAAKTRRCDRGFLSCVLCLGVLRLFRAHVAGGLFLRCEDEEDGGLEILDFRLMIVDFGLLIGRSWNDAVGDQRGLATGFVGSVVLEWACLMASWAAAGCRPSRNRVRAARVPENPQGRRRSRIRFCVRCDRRVRAHVRWADP